MMPRNARLAVLSLVGICASLIAAPAWALDSRNPLGADLIPYRKVNEAPDPRFNDPAQNRLIDSSGVLLEKHRARCAGENATGQPPEDCVLAPDKAKFYGCLNEVEAAWALWAGLYVTCDGVHPDRIYHACPCSCFWPETRLLTQDASGMLAPEWVRADQVTRESSIITLSDAASIEGPAFEARDILYTTYGLERPNLVHLELETGNVLRLTQSHAVLLSDGRMIAAKDVVVGDDLVDLQGRPIPVLAVESEPWGKEVYNLASAGTPKASHIIAAEGVLVGDLLWQNSLGVELGEVAIRSNSNPRNEDSRR